MLALSSHGLLELWERGRFLHPLDRGLLVISVADPAVTAAVADWPLGRRNHALFDVYASWFGPRLQGWTSCPSCAEKVEFELDARELAMASSGGPPDLSDAGAVMVGAYAFRLPTSRDLAHIVSLDAAESATGLLNRCRTDGPKHPEWTDDLLEAVENRLASADPLAETRLALSCPSCQRQWEDAFDIGRFLWTEVESRATRLLWEVHTLASAYGWSEPETLALGDARRAMYLEIVSA